MAAALLCLCTSTALSKHKDLCLTIPSDRGHACEKGRGRVVQLRRMHGLSQTGKTHGPDTNGMG